MQLVVGYNSEFPYSPIIDQKKSFCSGGQKIDPRLIVFTLWSLLGFVLFPVKKKKKNSNIFFSMAAFIRLK